MGFIDKDMAEDARDTEAVSQWHPARSVAPKTTVAAPNLSAARLYKS
jgi:hypothetical protein